LFATIPNRVAALGPVVRAIASLSMLKAAVIAAAAMLVTGCVTIGSARRSIDWSVLVAIAASFGLGAALEKTGAAKVIGSAIIDVSGGSPWYALAMLYVVTVIVTELITNNAAAALMFPFALATARNLDANPMSFIIVIMMAASAGFATPIGYQTNLMVYGPGGYRFSDYVKMGVPLDLLIGIITVLIAPWVWPFHS
jgi:di/tricarboxylate transporter